MSGFILRFSRFTHDFHLMWVISKKGESEFRNGRTDSSDSAIKQRQPHNPGLSEKAWKDLHQFVARMLIKHADKLKRKVA